MVLFLASRRFGDADQSKDRGTNWLVAGSEAPVQSTGRSEGSGLVDRVETASHPSLVAFVQTLSARTSEFLQKVLAGDKELWTRPAEFESRTEGRKG